MCKQRNKLSQENIKYKDSNEHKRNIAEHRTQEVICRIVDYRKDKRICSSCKKEKEIPEKVKN